MTFNLKNYLQECQVKINTALKEFLPPKNTFPPKLHESMEYSLFAGGKRIRPILCLAGAEACGGNQQEVLPVACALELIHTFSLIHDDLPAMDNDDLRRGVPTNHKVYGEALAILSGDALVTQAFYILSLTPPSNFPQGLPSVALPQGEGGCKKILEIIQDISQATGSQGMIGGQALDMEMQGSQGSLESLQKLHQLKTGHLITVSVTSGAKMVTDSKEKIDALKKYGEAIGLAFQIADDILDVEGGSEIGKDVGSDVQKGKVTYVSLLGIEQAKKEAKKQSEKALLSLSHFGIEAEPLRGLAKYIVERKK